MLTFFRIIRAIFAPAHMLREFVEDQRVTFGAGNILHVILCISVGSFLYLTSGISSVLDFIFATIIITVILAFLCRIFNYIMYGVLAVVSVLLYPFDTIWELCDMRVCFHENRAQKMDDYGEDYSSASDYDQSEDTELYYFIKRDKTSSHWNAQWLGD